MLTIGSIFNRYPEFRYNEVNELMNQKEIEPNKIEPEVPPEKEPKTEPGKINPEREPGIIKPEIVPEKHPEVEPGKIEPEIKPKSRIRNE